MTPLEAMADDSARRDDRVRLVVIYENCDAARRARHAFQTQPQQNGSVLSWSAHWWKFEMLTIPTLRAMAAEEAAEADLLVVAPQGGEPLPREVLEWIATALHNPSHPKGLLALMATSKEARGMAPSVETELGILAAHGAIPLWCIHLDTSDRWWCEPSYAKQDLEVVAHAVFSMVRSKLNPLLQGQLGDAVNP